jgi:hypothetical protein
VTSGCVTYGSHLTARSLAAGSRELSLNADALVIDRGLGPQLLPNPELGYRLGVGQSIDVGGRLNAGSLELNARWQLLSGKAALALVPALGFGFVPVTNRDTGLFNLHALGSALGSFRLRERWDLVVGARGGMTYAFPLTAWRGDASGDSVTLLAGGAIGLRFPLGKRSYLFPDLNLLFPYETQRDEWSFPTFQGGVALAFE